MTPPFSWISFIFLRPSRESSHGDDVPVPSLRCSRPTHSSSPFATLRDSTTILRTNSQTLYTEGLERLRHRQAVPGYEIVGSAEGPRGLRKRERKESAFSPLSESLVLARDDGAT